MVNIEDLQNKIQQKRNESFSNTAKKLKEKAKQLVDSERTQILNSIREFAENVNKMTHDNEQGMQSLIRYLEYQENKLKENNDRVSEINLDIAKSINALIDLQHDAPKITKNDITKIVQNSLTSFENIFLKDQISTYGKMTKDAQGRVTRIEERFDKFTLVTNFYYSENGAFEWSTEQIDE